MLLYLFVPVLFYDMVGEKKERITAALLEKRAKEEAEAKETEEVVNESDADSMAE